MNFATSYSRLVREVFGTGAATATESNAPAAPSIARGDMFVDDDADLVKSCLDGVDDARWSQFVHVMATAKLNAVSPSNALGMFELTPRRLADLGLLEKLDRSRSPAGKTVWVAKFVPPLTAEGFLKSPDRQYSAFCKSMRDYAKRIASGEIEKPEDMSLSGALAILHRAGPSGLNNWMSGDRFPATVALYTRTAGVF